MHILLLPSWYPETPDSTDGIFFREQAHALARAGLRVGVAAPLFRSPRRWRELQKRYQPLPCVPPDFDRLGVFPAKFTGLESIQAGTCGVLVSGCVDLTQCAGDLTPDVSTFRGAGPLLN